MGLYTYWVYFFWQCIHFVTICMHFFSSFSFQHITSIGIFARQTFFEIVFRATFNPGFGHIQLQTTMFLFKSPDGAFKCLYSTRVPII